MAGSLSDLTRARIWFATRLLHEPLASPRTFGAGPPRPCPGCNGRTKTGMGYGVCLYAPPAPLSSKVSGPHVFRTISTRLALITVLWLLLKSYNRFVGIPPNRMRIYACLMKP